MTFTAAGWTGRQQCGYIFAGKTVTMRCGLGEGHNAGHDAWVDVVTEERVTNR